VLTSTLLTLVVVPVAYTYLDSLGKRAARFFGGAGQHEEEVEDSGKVSAIGSAH
jgi:HAE1 family hydrophobic/amphiphilic exporter-1